MDKNVKIIVLLGVGGVGVYILWKGNYLQTWFPSLFGSSTPTTTPAAGTSHGTTPPATAPATPPPPAPPATPVGTQKTDAQGNVFTWNGSAWINNPLTCPSGQHPQNGVCTPYATTPTTPATTPQGCPDGQTNVNGVCVQTSTSESSRMLAAAGGVNSQNMDQWCYYWTQVSGAACPVDPGAIDPGVYQGAFGAGFTNPDGSPPDRTTPMDIGTWIAIINNQDPSQGLTGMAGLAAMRIANAWLT